MTHPTAMQKDSKPALTPKLRFPEFRNSPGWPIRTLAPFLEEVAERVPPETDLPIYSSTRTGLKPQDDYYDGRILLNKSEYGVVPPGCFVYRHMSDDGLFKFNINDTGSPIAVSKEYPVFKAVNLDPRFLLNKLNFGADFERFALSQKAGGTRTRLYLSKLAEWETPIPSIHEQQKIAECLSTLDELIGAESQKLDALKAHKKGLMQQLFPREGETLPRLRFPEFRNAPQWKSKTVDELVDTITPPKKLLTSDYRPAGQFPVIDQSQDYICGWTDDEEAVIGDDLPVVVFGDHTCALKFVDRPFAQGADGIKILKAKAEVRDDFLFYSLQANPVQQESYKRHFSTLRERVVAFPDKDTGEQHRIATCLSSLDDLIAAHSDRLSALQIHKQGLLQQLFPVAGENA